MCPGVVLSRHYSDYGRAAPALLPDPASADFNSLSPWMCCAWLRQPGSDLDLWFLSAIICLGSSHKKNPAAQVYKRAGNNKTDQCFSDFASDRNDPFPVLPSDRFVLK